MKPAIFLTVILSIGCSSLDNHDQLENRIVELEHRVIALESRESLQAESQQDVMTAQLAQLHSQKTELLKRCTSSHPQVIAIDNKIQALEMSVKRMPLQEELRKLKNKRSKMALHLTDKHPELQRIDEDISKIENELDGS